MCIMCAFLCAIFSVLLASGAQNDASKPKVSSEPLTTEQIAVYRAVLSDYLKVYKGVLNVSNKTELLDQSDSSFNRACISGIPLESGGNLVPAIQQLNSTVGLNLKIVLVDPDRQEAKVKEGDPQNLVKTTIDDGENVSHKQIEDSVNQAFKNGLFTVSEIIFDKEHRRAVVSYSFVCGRLCGNGDTLILKKVDQKWVVSKRCGWWIS